MLLQATGPMCTMKFFLLIHHDTGRPPGVRDTVLKGRSHPKQRPDAEHGESGPGLPCTTLARPDPRLRLKGHSSRVRGVKSCSVLGTLINKRRGRRGGKWVGETAPTCSCLARNEHECPASGHVPQKSWRTWTPRLHDTFPVTPPQQPSRRGQAVPRGGHPVPSHRTGARPLCSDGFT